MRKGSRFTALHVGPPTHSSWGEAAAGPTACRVARRPWNGKKESWNRVPSSGARQWAELCHIARSPGPADSGQPPGRDPAWAATRGPPSSPSLILPPYSLRSLSPLAMPLSLPLEVRGDNIGRRELLRSVCGSMCHACSTQPIHNQGAINGLLAFSSPVFRASLVSTQFSRAFHFSLLSTLESSTCHCPPGSRPCDSSFHVIAAVGG